MKLQNKVYVFILIAWGLMFALVFLGIKQILIANYLELENKVAADAVARVKEAIDQKVVAVEGTVITWAVWDDAYKFAVGQNPGFVQQVFTPASMAAADVDIAFVYSPEGKTVYEKALNADRSDYAPLPPEFVKAFQKKGDLQKYILNPTVDTADRGLYLLPQNMLMMAIHAILTNEGKGPPHGTIAVAKWFKEADWKEVKEATKMNADFYTLADINKNPSLQAKYEALQKNNGSYTLDRISSDILHEYALLNDITGRPIAMIKVILPRSVYQAGMNSIFNFTMLFLLFGTALAIILSRLLRNIVVKRLERINNEIIFVGDTKNFNTSIPIQGNDEVSSLGVEANKMFSTIGKYDAENKKYLAQINYELEQSNILSQKLKKAEQFLNDVINSMPSMIVIIDENKKILQLNDNSEKESKKVSEQAKGMSLFKLFPYLTQYEDQIDQVINSNQPQELHKVVQVKEGEHEYFNVLIFPLSQGKMLALRIDNVTDLIKLQETMLQNEKLASIGVITAGVTHEIKAPINFFLTAADSLKNDLEKTVEFIRKYTELKVDDKFIQQLAEVNKQGKEIDFEKILKDTGKLLDDTQVHGSTIASMVKNLQAFSRIDEDAMKPYDITEGINSTLRLLSHRVTDQVRVVKEFGNVPKINCYPGKMNQMFMSIIANALDAMSDKGELKITTAVKDNKVLISFKDTGVGIAQENLDKIFDPLFTTKDESKATGLGLSNIRIILEDIHGKIQVKSALGLGTEFVISIPLTK